MNCIILGDKYQNGMKSRGCCALIKTNKNTNMLTHQYNILSSVFSNIKIIYVYGFDNKKFIDFYKQCNLNVNIVYNENYNRYNQAHSLSLAKDFMLNGETIIIDGYQKINKSNIKKIKFNQNCSYLFINKNSTCDSERVGCIIDGDTIKSLSLDLSNVIKDIYYFNKECSRDLSCILNDKKNQNNFIFELINRLIDNDHNIKPITYN